MVLSTLKSYGHSFQVEVLTALLTDKEFLRNVSDALSDEYFDNQAHQYIIQQVLSYFNKYNTTPTPEILQIEVKKIENEILKLTVIEELRQAYKIEGKDLRYVEEEFLAFCKNQQLKNALISSVDMLKIADYDSIRTIIGKALNAGSDKNVGHEYKKDIETRYREDNRAPIPFPWPTFNKITQNGYGKGDLVLVFGPPGSGKSWSIIAMAAHAIKLGYKVVYYALELGESYVGKRIDACLTGIPVDAIDKRREDVEALISALPGEIIIKEYAPKRASLATIEKHLYKLKNQCDFTPDVIFIDYLDLLKGSVSRKEKKDETDDVFVEAKGLAKELGIPLVSPSQINRAGSKDDIIESDKIAGSFDKIMIGDISVSLSRKRKDKMKGTGRWHFMKNRYGKDGVTYASRIDTSTGIIDIDDKELEDEDIEGFVENSKPLKPGELDRDEKEYLRNKFFEITG